MAGQAAPANGRRARAKASVANSGKSGAGLAGAGILGALGAFVGPLIGDGDPSATQNGALLGGSLGTLLGPLVLKAVTGLMRSAGWDRTAAAVTAATAADSAGGAALTPGELRTIAHGGLDDLLDAIDGVSDHDELGRIRDRLADKMAAAGVLYEGDVPPDAVAPTGSGDLGGAMPDDA